MTDGSGPLPPSAWLTLLRMALGADLSWDERAAVKAHVPLAMLGTGARPRELERIAG
jgi:hypothetical protein